MLFSELRQLGDGAADRDTHGTGSYGNRNSWLYNHTTVGNDRASDSNHDAGGGAKHDANSEHAGNNAADWFYSNEPGTNAGNVAEQRDDPE